MGRGRGRGPQVGTSGVQGHVYPITQQAESADQPVILSHPNSWSDSIGRSEPSSGCENIY